MQASSPIRQAERIAIEKGFFYYSFFLAAVKEIFAQGAVRFDELAAEENGDWSQYLRLLATLSRAQQYAADALPEELPPLKQGHTVLPAADGSRIPLEFYPALRRIVSQMATVLEGQ